MTAPSPDGRPAPSAEPERASLGELFGEVTKDLSELMRQELALAKAEAQESAKRASTGVGLLGGAAWAANMIMLFLSLGLWWVLGALLGEGDREPALGWAALIVAVIWGVVAAFLYVRGKAELRKTKGLPQTADTLKKIPDAFTGQDQQ